MENRAASLSTSAYPPLYTIDPTPKFEAWGIGLWFDNLLVMVQNRVLCFGIYYFGLL